MGLVSGWRSLHQFALHLLDLVLLWWFCAVSALKICSVPVLVFRGELPGYLSSNLGYQLPENLQHIAQNRLAVIRRKAQSLNAVSLLSCKIVFVP